MTKGMKYERPWKTEDTNCVGLSTYKEKHCWRHVFELDKENSGDKLNYQMQEAWKRLTYKLDVATTNSVQGKAKGPSIDYIK